MSTLKAKSFEIFCGTGGVGKTTLATARALNLARNGKKVLLITIDPSRRLKDLLGLKNTAAGEVVPVELLGVQLSALLMSSEKTIERMAKTFESRELAENRIVKILSRPYGGMNEILSMVEVQMQFDTGQFEVVVLDTPPGPHFLDFLESLEKIRSFFDQNFIEIFSYLGQKSAKAGKKVFGGVINKFISSGVKKLLGHLQKVTGTKFIDDFIEAIEIIYKSRHAFTKGLALQDKLKSPELCNWFLVTSVEQGKAQEAIEMQTHATHFIHQDHFLVLNKCLEEEINSWEPAESKLVNIKQSLQGREKVLKKQLKAIFPVVLEFSEVISLSPTDHIKNLANEWSKYDYQG